MNLLDKIDHKIEQLEIDFKKPIAIYLGRKEFNDFKQLADILCLYEGGILKIDAYRVVTHFQKK